MAGLTVAVILLPQALAYAVIAELPPQMGLYAAIVASIVAALWGSSSHLQTGPTNPSSLLVLSVLLAIALPGTPEYILAAGLMAVMVGVAKLFMGVARLGVLVNFVSDSVIIGFTAGAGVLIGVNQLRHMFRVEIPSSALVYETLYATLLEITDIHRITFFLGAVTIVTMVVVKRFWPKLPNALIATVVASLLTWIFNLPAAGVRVVGELPQTLPPFSRLPVFDLELIGNLSNGALAAAAIGLVEAVAIGRSISAQTGEHLDSNQEFVGQGLACIASGFFSGYAVSGSYTRTAVNYDAGARTGISNVFVGLWVLAIMFLIAPLTAYLPISAIAGVLIVSAYGLIDWREIKRINETAFGDSLIMFTTLTATLLLPLQFAVLIGVLVSFARFLVKTSTPLVYPVVPDRHFRHFVREDPDHPACPQMGIIAVEGPLYFGAVHHVEEAIRDYMECHPEQRYLLLRLHLIDHCDVSGIHMLESVARLYRMRGGDVFLIGARPQVKETIRVSGLAHWLGSKHMLGRASALNYLFHKVFNPSVCIYECDRRVFAECQALPKHTYHIDLPTPEAIPTPTMRDWLPSKVKDQLENDNSTVVIDVREPNEYASGHIESAQLLPLRDIVAKGIDLPHNCHVVIVCRSGRRSTHATHILQDLGYTNIYHLKGGMLAWEAAGYPIAIE